jgi:PhnB protein
MVQAIPTDYRGVTAYLILRDASRALDFYRRAFGAEQTLRLDGPDGKVAHAEMRICGGIVMMSEENVAMGHRSAQTLGGSPIHLMFYVEDVDAAFARATAAGGKVDRPVQDQFYGDRSGTLTDPFGISWTLASHIEDVTPEEVSRRMAQMGSDGANG